jgi:hypothetical protein
MYWIVFDTKAIQEGSRYRAVGDEGYRFGAGLTNIRNILQHAKCAPLGHSPESAEPSQVPPPSEIPGDIYRDEFWLISATDQVTSAPAQPDARLWRNTRRLSTHWKRIGSGILRAVT